MNARLLLAALLGGLTIFFWGFVSHMLLPLGTMGMGGNLGKELATNIVSALLLAWVLLLVGPALGKRLGAALAMSVFATLAANAVRVPAGHAATAALGAMFGPIAVEKA